MTGPTSSAESRVTATAWLRSLYGHCRRCGRPRAPENEGTPCPAMEADNAK